jgi:hypothetical protein
MISLRLAVPAVLVAAAVAGCFTYFAAPTSARISAGNKRPNALSTDDTRQV